MKIWIIRYLGIGVAGAVGAILRVLVGQIFGRINLQSFPLGTFLINITGSMFLGWFLTYVDANHLSDTKRLVIGSGFVGAYTTFSTFMFETDKLSERGAIGMSSLYLVGSIVVGLAAVRMGILLGRRG